MSPFRKRRPTFEILEERTPLAADFSTFDFGAQRHDRNHDGHRSHHHQSARQLQDRSHHDHGSHRHRDDRGRERDEHQLNQQQNPTAAAQSVLAGEGEGPSQSPNLATTSLGFVAPQTPSQSLFSFVVTTPPSPVSSPSPSPITTISTPNVFVQEESNAIIDSSFATSGSGSGHFLESKGRREVQTFLAQASNNDRGVDGIRSSLTANRLIALAHSNWEESRLDVTEDDNLPTNSASVASANGPMATDVAFADWNVDDDAMFVVELELAIGDEEDVPIAIEADHVTFEAEWLDQLATDLQLFRDGANRLTSCQQSDSFEEFTELNDDGLIQLVHAEAMEDDAFDEASGAPYGGAASLFELSADMEIFQAMEVAVRPGAVSLDETVELIDAAHEPVSMDAVSAKASAAGHGIEPGWMNSWSSILVMATVMITGATSSWFSFGKVRRERDSDALDSSR